MKKLWRKSLPLVIPVLAFLLLVGSAWLSWGVTLSPLLQTPKSVLMAGYDVDADMLKAVAISAAGAGSGSAGGFVSVMHGRNSVGNNQIINTGDFATIDGSAGMTVAVTPYFANAVGNLIRQKDVAEGDGETTGLPATGPYGFNGTTWDRARTAAGDAQAATGLMAAGGMAFNGTTWDRARTSVGDAQAATGMTAAAQTIFNGTTWDRLRSSTIGDQSPPLGIMATMGYIFDDTNTKAWRMRSSSVQVDASTGQGLVAQGQYVFNGALWDRARGDVANGADVDVTRTVWSTAVVNITTNTSTVVKATPGVFNTIHLNVSGTTSNVRLYNDATAPCDTGFMFQYDTATPAVDHDTHNHFFSIGLCALTAGAAAADISVLYQ